MKIKPEHLEHLKKEIDQFLIAHPSMVGDYEIGQFVRSSSVRDLQKRFCFDLVYIVPNLNVWVCDNLTKYMDDTHLFTALKACTPKLTRKY